MWFSIISALIFLALTTILFTPELRKFPIYKSLSFFFLFEGAYTIFNFIVTELWTNFTYMSIIHDIGCIILGAYVLITAYNYKNQNKELLEKESKTFKNSDIHIKETLNSLKETIIKDVVTEETNKPIVNSNETKEEKAPTASKTSSKTTNKKTTSTSRSKTTGTRSRTTKSTASKKTSTISDKETKPKTKSSSSTTKTTTKRKTTTKKTNKSNEPSEKIQTPTANKPNEPSEKIQTPTANKPNEPSEKIQTPTANKPNEPSEKIQTPTAEQQKTSTSTNESQNK